MRLACLGALGVALAAAACDPTSPTTTGTSRSGTQVQRALVFAVQPASAAAGAIITPAIDVEVRDSLGNTDVSFTGNVTVALGANRVGAFLDGTKTVAPVSGVARFGELSVNRAASGYTLVATAPGATSATSAAFDITTP